LLERSPKSDLASQELLHSSNIGISGRTIAHIFANLDKDCQKVYVSMY